MSDDALEAARREVARAPDDAAARLRLAAALARVGLRDDAVEATLLATALGAPPASTRPLLAGLDAPASPWSHSWRGDAARTGVAPVRGPRRGEVVASAALRPTDVWFAVLLADGTLLLATERGRRLEAFDGRTLQPRGDWLALDDHARQVVALPDGRALLSTSGGVFAHPGPRPLLGEHASLAVRPDGAVVLATVDRVELRGPDLELRDTHTPGLAPSSVVVSLAAAGARVVVGVEGPRERRAGRHRRGLLHLDLDGDQVVFVAASLDEAWAPSTLAAGPALGAGDRAVVVEADVDPDGIELEYALVAHDLAAPSDGALARRRWRRLWSAPIGATCELLSSVPPPVPLVLCPDGSCRFSVDGELLCFDPAGVRRWSAPTYGAWWVSGLLADRDGVAYAPTHGGLAAWSPDGAQVFELRQALRPLALDARGRLLAVRADERGARELVAIA